MSKGIREAALSKEEPAYQPYQSTLTYPHYRSGDYEAQAEYDFGGIDRDYETDYISGSQYARKEYRSIESIRLAPGTFELSLAIPMDDLGEAGNPDDVGYTFEGMLDMAEDVAIIEATKIIPTLKEQFKVSVDSVENIDDVTVLLTLEPRPEYIAAEKEYRKQSAKDILEVFPDSNNSYKSK